MHRRSNGRHKSGFAQQDLIGLLVMLGILGLLILIILPAFHMGGHNHKPMKDAYQIRDLHRAMIAWSQQNGDRYPLPSQLDRDDATVRVDGEATLKDSTGAIYSILVFNELVKPDDFYSPAESSGVLRSYHEYQHSEPTAALDPAKARWDPSFRGTPFDPLPDGGEAAEEVAHTSYAHLALAGAGRMKNWGFTADSAMPILGNRGPEETGATWIRARAPGDWDYERLVIESTTLAAGPTGTESITLLIHGTKTAWEGNIAYNDNHVVMEESTHPGAVQYIVIQPSPYGASGIETRRIGDGLFLDEGDPGILSGEALEDTRDANCYLGLFRRGPTVTERVEHEQAVKFIKQARWFDGMTE